MKIESRLKRLSVRIVKPRKAKTPKFITAIFERLIESAFVDELPLRTCTSAAIHAMQRKLRRMLFIEIVILSLVCSPNYETSLV